MKRILLLLCFVVPALAGLSPAADIQLGDNGTVTRDSIALNNVSDALLNQQLTSREFMDAIKAKFTAHAAALAAAQTAQTNAEAKLETLIAGAKLAISKNTSAERLAAAAEMLAKVQATAADAERDELEKQAAEIAAKIQALPRP